TGCSFGRQGAPDAGCTIAPRRRPSYSCQVPGPAGHHGCGREATAKGLAGPGQRPSSSHQEARRQARGRVGEAGAVAGWHQGSGNSHPRPVEAIRGHGHGTSATGGAASQCSGSSFGRHRARTWAHPVPSRPRGRTRIQHRHRRRRPLLSRCRRHGGFRSTRGGTTSGRFQGAHRQGSQGPLRGSDGACGSCQSRARRVPQAHGHQAQEGLRWRRV
ncbi:unnamed protein product, partial [Prorocentrum cordatum]